MLGYDVTEMIGKSYFSFIDAGNQPVAKQKLLQRSQGMVEKYDFQFLRKDGSSLWTIVSARPIFDSKGCYKGSLGMFTDITDRKKMEQEMAHLDRLKIIGQIATGIGHEIRNPMTTVRGYLQLLSAGKQVCNNEETYAVMIEELDRANAIITEFLSLAKNKALQLNYTDINNMYPLLQANAMASDKTIKLALEEVPGILVEEKEIRQLLLNLVRNGLEAMEPGKEITIKTYFEDSNIVLEIKDEGTGIAASIIDKLGTPFFTTKDQGTGLGLAICYGIASKHNATIDFISSKSGTTFFVRFKHNSNIN